MRWIVFLLTTMMLLFPSWGGCEGIGEVTKSKVVISLIALPQYEEMFDVLTPFLGLGTENIAEILGGMIPYRGSPCVTLLGEPAVEIELDIDNYWGPKMVTWQTNNFPLRMVRGIEIGMTLAEVWERLFQTQKGSVSATPTCEVGLWYKLSDGNVESIHLINGNGELCIETSLEFTAGTLSKVEMHITEASEGVPKE